MSELTLVIGNRNYSSWSMRAWLPLAATGVEFNEVVIPLGRADTADRIRRLSPNGLVPALHDGELVISDSLAIGEYLAEQFPEAGLWPEDKAARAVARSVCADMHSGFTAVRSNMPMNVRASYPGAGRGPGVETEVDHIVSIWERCRRDFGSDGRLLFGGFTLADAFYAPIVSRFRTYGVETGGVAAAYMDAVWHLPSVIDWVSKANAEEWVVERYER